MNPTTKRNMLTEEISSYQSWNNSTSKKFRYHISWANNGDYRKVKKPGTNNLVLADVQSHKLFETVKPTYNQNLSFYSMASLGIHY